MFMILINNLLLQQYILVMKLLHSRLQSGFCIKKLLLKRLFTRIVGCGVFGELLSK